MSRTSYPSDALEQFQVRLSAGLRDQIRDTAAANGRSMNSEIITRLEASFDPPRSVVPEIAKLLEDFIQHEVESRLLAMARNLTGAA